MALTSSRQPGKHRLHSRRTRTLRGALGRVVVYAVLAWCITYSVAGFVAPSSLTTPQPTTPPVVIDAGGAR